MSAISLIWNADGRPVDAPSLDRVVGVGAHRGPDGTHTSIDGALGLGYSSLETMGEGSANRPLWRRDLGLVVVADARIDNIADVEAAARDRGLAARGSSDAERILLAYAVWGDECADRLLGDFAFALVDLARRRVFLARDYIGMRQLHYSVSGGRLVAATEPRQVACGLDVEAAVNWAHVGDELCLNWRNVTETFYAGVRRLPAGHTAAVSSDGVRLNRYWKPESIPSIQPRSAEEAASEFRDLLTEAVRCRLRASCPVLISLSGGLDSSSIACLAAEMKRGPATVASIRTMSLVYPRRPEDERPYIEAVVRQTGLPAVFVPYDDIARGTASAPARAADFPDVPYEPGHFAQAAIAARAIRAESGRVVLEGIGGDELFVRHGIRVADAMRRGQWVAAWRLSRRMAAAEGRSPGAVMRDDGLRPLVPAGARRAGRRALRRFGVGAYKTVSPWVDDSFARTHGLEARAEEARRTEPSRRSSAFAAYCDLLTHGYNMAVGLPAIESMDAALGIESRQPFLDRRVVEFSLQLPDECRVPDGRSKELLRRAMGAVLPDLVRERRSKADFGGLRNDFLDRHGPAVAELLETPELERAGAVARGGARALLSRALDGEAAGLTAVLAVLKMELWYRTWLTSREKELNANDRSCTVV